MLSRLPCLAVHNQEISVRIGFGRTAWVQPGCCKNHCSERRDDQVRMQHRHTYREDSLHTSIICSFPCPHVGSSRSSLSSLVNKMVLFIALCLHLPQHVSEPYLTFKTLCLPVWYHFPNKGRSSSTLHYKPQNMNFSSHCSSPSETEWHTK